MTRHGPYTHDRLTPHPTRCRYCDAPIEPLTTDTGHNPPRLIWTHHHNGEHYERCLPDWADTGDDLRAEP
jgi:hypothetical protein